MSDMVEQPLLPGQRVRASLEIGQEEQTFIAEIIDVNWDEPTQQWIYKIKFAGQERMISGRGVTFLW